MCFGAEHMFRRLKERLKSFTDKAEKELGDLEDAEERVAEAKKPEKEDRGKREKKAKKQKHIKRKSAKKSEKKGKSEGQEEIFTASKVGKKLREGKLEDLLWELEMALLESDVALPVVEKIKMSV